VIALNKGGNEMDEYTVEERRMIYTEWVYLKASEITGTERAYDDTWYDTVSSRPMTELEIKEYGA